MDRYLFVVVLLIAALVVCTIVVTRLIRSSQAKQKIALQRLGGAIGEWKPGRKVPAVHDGVDYELYYFPGAQSSPPTLSVTVPCVSKGGFRITRESDFDRFFKRIGITSEIQTHDMAFDEDFFIHTDTVEPTGRFFGRPEARQTVREILDLGYTSVEKDGKAVKATWVPFRLKDNTDPELITGAVSRLGTLAEDWPTASEAASTPLEAAKWKARRSLAFAVPSLLALGGIPLLIYSLANFRPLDVWILVFESLKVSLPLMLLFVWSAASLVRGRSSSHQELIAVFVLALIGFPVAGAGLEMFLNGRLDTSPPSLHTVTAVEKYTTQSKNTTSYHIVLQSWRPNRETERVGVSKDTYSITVPKATKFTVVTRRGRFDHEWRVSLWIEPQDG